MVKKKKKIKKRKQRKVNGLIIEGESWRVHYYITNGKLAILYEKKR